MKKNRPKLNPDEIIFCKNCGHPIVWMDCSINDWRHSSPEGNFAMCYRCLREYGLNDKVCVKPEPGEVKKI